MPYTYDYPRPAVAADVALFATEDATLKVLLIRRKNLPFKDMWALPGGFVDMDEELIDAARRELREETGIKVRKMLQLGAYGKLGRDPRERTISAAYMALRLGLPPPVQAADDATDARWFNARRPPKLAFDHVDILRDARQYLSKLANNPPELVKALLPPSPKPDQLVALLGAIDGRTEPHLLRQRLEQFSLL